MNEQTFRTAWKQVKIPALITEAFKGGEVPFGLYGLERLDDNVWAGWVGGKIAKPKPIRLGIAWELSDESPVLAKLQSAVDRFAKKLPAVLDDLGGTV
jgi:hypothetical protein